MNILLYDIANTIFRFVLSSSSSSLLLMQVITFPECLEQLFENCLSLVNTQAQELGLDPYEIVIHEKRNIDQPGYNKVVIVTDMLGELVMGRLGDGIVTYPFQWDDAVLGPRTLSVDGKWNCLGYTPEDCCNSIKQSEFWIVFSCTFFSYAILTLYDRELPRQFLVILPTRCSQPQHQRRLHCMSHLCSVRWCWQSQASR